MSIIAVLLILCLTACNTNGNASQMVSPIAETPTEIPTKEITPTPTSKPTPTPTPTLAPIRVTPTVYDDSRPYIVWALHFSGSVYDEAQAEIQKFLDEKGIDCRIYFIRDAYYEISDEYARWIDGAQAGNVEVDIVTTNGWNYTGQAYAFAERELYPLNDFLESEEGSELWNAYSEVEWMEASINGKNYTMPQRRDMTSDGIYLYVKEEYKSIFDTVYDESYDSLQKFCSMIPEENQIVCTGLMSYLYAFLGYSDVLYAPYNVNEGKFLNVLEQDGIREYGERLYSDYVKGKLRIYNIYNDSDVELPPDNAAVYIYRTTGQRTDEIPGYVKVELMPDVHVGMGISYGILETSTHKELALQVMAACYSDPEIASLLWWGEKNPEKWLERTAALREEQPSAVSGFFPYIEDWEWLALEEYNTVWLSVVSNILVQSSDGASFRINANYLEYLDELYSKQYDYGELVDEMNRQMEEWREAKE